MFIIDDIISALVGQGVENVQDKLWHSEKVLQLLPRFGLKPDAPPNDFEGVYVYTLIEYGLGKPKVILELFRQNEIQTEFEKAFSGNKNFDFQKLDNYIDSFAIGDEIKRQNIDYNQELAEFIRLFIEVAQRARTPTEILQDHKIDNLQGTLNQIRKQFNNLNLVALQEQINKLAQSYQQLLPPSPAARETELAKSLRDWFNALGYKFEQPEVLEAEYFQWIINIPKRRGYDRILIRGVEGEANINDVNAVKQGREKHKTDEGWVVARRRVSKLARKEAEKSQYSGVYCYTLDELIEADADFTGYFEWLEQQVIEKGIDKYYVPLACIKEEVDLATKRRIGISHYGREDGWIDRYVNNWLADPVKEHLSILGEFGTGKTWFAFHYAWEALKKYRQAKQEGSPLPRIPVVVPLRDYAKAVTIQSLFSEFFFRKHQIGLANYSVFEQLNRMGKLLLIFDGFDEMAARVDRQAMINNFWELAKVVVPGAKAILTCRTEHFPEALEGRRLLNAELKASTAYSTGEPPQFEVLELEKLDDEQIRQVISFKAQPETVEYITHNQQLLDLARRPVMIDLIIEALPEIEAGKPVDISRVYLYAVRHKMERDIKSVRTFTSMAQKLYFLCELSWQMLSTETMTLNYKEFPDRIRRCFAQEVQEQKDLDHWHYDMMGQTMLIRNADGDYYPAHRSLLEFFVAYKFARELGILADDFREVVDVMPYDQGISDGDLTQTFGKTLLTKAVLDLMCPMLSALANERLLEVVKGTKGKTEVEAGYCGSNAVQLLIKGNRFALERQDLSQTVLPGVDFSRASLYRVDLTEADLQESVFARVLTSVFTVAFSPDGKVLATGEVDGRVRLWNASSGKELLTLTGHESSVYSVAWSEDGLTLASGSEDKTVKLWDVQTGDCRLTLAGHSDWVRSVAWSGDGLTLASCSRDNTVKLWDVQTGDCRLTLAGHEGSVNSVAWSGDGLTLASGSEDKTVKLWDVQTGDCRLTLAGHESSVWSVTWSRDGLTLASGGDKTVKLWDVQTGDCRLTLAGHESSVWSVAWSGDGLTLASGSEDKTVKLWDVQTGDCRLTLAGHSDWVRSVAWSGDGLTLASASSDKTVKLWDVQTGDYRLTLAGHESLVWSVAWSGDSLTLASASSDKTVKLWDVQTGDCRLTLAGHQGLVNSVAWSGDGLTLASASSDGTVKLWDVQTGDCRLTLAGHKGSVLSVVWSGDGLTLASGGGDKTVKLWDVQTGNCRLTLAGHQGSVWSVAWSGDGLTFASSSDDKTVKLWDVQTGDCHLTLAGHQGSVWSVAWSGDGLTFASGGSDGTVKLWNVQTGDCRLTLAGHESLVWSVAWSGDGLTLASGGSDGTVKLWDVQTGDCRLTLAGHQGSVWSVAWSGDGLTLASGGDNTVKLWDVRTGDCIATFSHQLYAGLKIKGVKGLTQAEILSLKALGAMELGE